MFFIVSKGNILLTDPSFNFCFMVGGGGAGFPKLIIKSFLSEIHNIHITISKSYRIKIAALEFDTPRYKGVKF